MISAGELVLSVKLCVNADGAVVGDREGGFVGGDAMDEDLHGVVGDEDIVDGRALGAGLSGDAVEGVYVGGCADGCYFRAVGKNLFHILNRFAVRVGVKVARDENGKLLAVFRAQLVLFLEHLADVVNAPHLALDGIGCVEIVGFKYQRAVRVDDGKLFAALLVGNDSPRHRLCVGAAAAVKLAAALDQIEAIVAVEDGREAMLVLGVTECDGGVEVAKSVKERRSDAVDLLHTDQVGIARAIVICDQREAALKGFIK